MKPADVSQEAWDAAIAAQDAAIERCKAERLVYPFPTCNGKAVLDECVARAIMAAVAAEREACLQIANTALYTPISDGANVDTKPEAAYYMAEKIVLAIRARGEP